MLSNVKISHLGPVCSICYFHQNKYTLYKIALYYNTTLLVYKCVVDEINFLLPEVCRERAPVRSRVISHRFTITHTKKSLNIHLYLGRFALNDEKTMDN